MDIKIKIQDEAVVFPTHVGMNRVTFRRRDSRPWCSPRTWG